jgi:WD40 repeat protein
VSYYRYEKEKLSRYTELKCSVNKIAINPRNHYQFIAVGDNYIRTYDASDKVFKELKDPVLPVKYEKENDFVDIGFFPDSSVFTVVSKSRNVFIVDNNTILYYIQAEF